MQLSLSYPHSQGYQLKVALIAKNDFQKCYLFPIYYSPENSFVN